MECHFYVIVTFLLISMVVTLRLFNNNFKGYRELKGYNKDEILRVKKTITALKSDKAKSQELDEFLKSELKLDINTLFTSYFNDVKTFSEEFLFTRSKKDYSSLKQAIMSELKLISSNVTNLSSNGRNLKRLIKNNEYLDEFLYGLKLIKLKIYFLNLTIFQVI